MDNSTLKPKLLHLLAFAHEQQRAFLAERSESEKTEIGTPDHWAVKDQLFHTTIWIQRLTQQIAALQHGEEPPHFPDFARINAQTFEEQQHTPFVAILQQWEQVYTNIVALLQTLSDDNLTNPDFARPLNEGISSVFPGGRPLWDTIVITTYSHVQEHLAQYYLDRDDLERATHIWESWVAYLVQTDVPPIMASIALYNLACFHAVHNQLEKARPPLQQALQLNPHLIEFSKHDSDLIALQS